MPYDQTVLTPSDIAFLKPAPAIRGNRFSETVLLAAIAALVEQGDVTLSWQPRRFGGDLLMHFSGESSFPRDSVEARLVATQASNVRECVHDWLVRKSNDPWARATEQVWVTLVLRGHAVVKEDGMHAATEATAAAIADLEPFDVELALARAGLDDEMQSRLGREVSRGFSSRHTHIEQDVPHAWRDESAETVSAMGLDKLFPAPGIATTGVRGNWDAALILPALGFGLLGLILSGGMLGFALLCGLLGAAYGGVNKWWFGHSRSQISAEVERAGLRAQAATAESAPAPRTSTSQEAGDGPGGYLTLDWQNAATLRARPRRDDDPYSRFRIYRLYRRAYQHGILIVLAAVTLVASPLPHGFLIFLSLFPFIADAMYYLLHRRDSLAYVSLDDAILGRTPEIAIGILPLPTFATVMCWLWLLTLLMMTPNVGLVVAGLYIALTWIVKSRLRHRLVGTHTVSSLLTLRVFDSPSLLDYLEMVDAWRVVGPVYRLDGADTAATSWRDRFRVLTGRVDEIVLDDGGDLQSKFDDIEPTPDRNDRYPIEAFQFNNAFWRQALDEIVIRSDLVVMYLADFNDEDLGCVYELGVLLNRVRLSRIILFVNRGTDMALLERTLQEAWARIEPDSPNAGADGQITLIDIGGTRQIAPDQDLRDYNRRLKEKVRASDVIPMLFERARQR